MWLGLARLKISQRREKESTRDAVQVAIWNFLDADNTGSPIDRYTEEEVKTKSTAVYTHILTVPSPFYQSALG
jgi:type I restriction enzyme R subunit